MQEVTLIVDDQLLEAISLEAKSSILTVQLNTGKYIDIVRGLLIFQEGYILLQSSNVRRVRNGYVYRAG